MDVPPMVTVLPPTRRFGDEDEVFVAAISMASTFDPDKCDWPPVPYIPLVSPVNVVAVVPV